MEIIEVETSSAIEKIVYDDSEMFIKFVGNGWYLYRNFPATLFAEFKVAASKGAFLNQRIKPCFKGEPCANLEL
ncbi:MAG: KTSC domain-containing protein [Selenomonadaceae bacterium]|nr:KTSC domain-containing protein [Selenomonadaceae bacterium]